MKNEEVEYSAIEEPLRTRILSRFDCFQDILHYPFWVLPTIINVNIEDAERLQQYVAYKYLAISKIVSTKSTANIFTTVNELMGNTSYLSSGCTILDNQLLSGNGFMANGHLYEISGCSAAGKTQFCLQLLLNVQLSKISGGLDAGAVYYSTEATFPTQRLYQLYDQPKYKEYLKDPGSKIFITSPRSFEELAHHITFQLPNLLEKKAIRLVIIDSIAACFRTDDAWDSQSTVSAQERSKAMFELSSKLRFLGEKYQTVIVLTNQVTAHSDELQDFKYCGTVDIPASSRDGSTVVSALGLNWATCINTRFMMSRIDQSILGMNGISRGITVMFSPYLKRGKQCKFKVTADGVKGYTNV